MGVEVAVNWEFLDILRFAYDGYDEAAFQDVRLGNVICLFLDIERLCVAPLQIHECDKTC